MKRVALNFTFIRLSLLAILFILGVSCKENSKTENPDTPASAANTGTAIAGIAFIRADSVINNYDMYHDLKAELEKEVKQKESELKNKVNSFQKDAAELQRKFQENLITRSQAEEQGEKLQRRQQELEETSSKMRMALAEKEAVMGRQINDAMTKYIEKYNSDGKYSLIISNAAIFYGTPSMDITKAILDGMNKEYIANKDKLAND